MVTMQMLTGGPNFHECMHCAVIKSSHFKSDASRLSVCQMGGEGGGHGAGGEGKGGSQYRR